MSKLNPQTASLSRQGPTSAIIVPIYNEEKYLKYVINSILKAKVFDEVICVNDGSTDKSQQILESFKNKIYIIKFDKNRGKSYAMVAGVKATKSDIIAFCDADLVNVKKEHFTQLVDPLKYNIADQVLATRETDRLIFKHLTGERAYRRKDLLPHLDRIEPTKFGIETYLNYIFSNKRTLWITTKGLSQAGKMRESTFAFDYVKEGYQILSEIIRQKDMGNKKLAKQLKKLQKKFNDNLSNLEKILPGG